MSPDPRGVRIVLLTRSLEQGGAERQICVLATGLHERGIPVRVVSFYPGGALAAPLRAAGVEVVDVGKRSRWDLIGFGRRLLAAVGEHRPTVLYGFLNGPNLVSLVVAPVVGRPTLAWGVRSTTMDLAEEDRFVAFVYRLEARLSRWADVVICNSYAGRDDARDRGMARDRLVVVPNGIEVDRFMPFDEGRRAAARERWAVPAEAPVVGAVGRLHPMKDLPTLVAAMGLLGERDPAVHLVVVGSDPDGLGGDLARQAADAGLGGRVHLVGPIDDVTGVYPGFDVLVSSSSYGEGFSNVVGEAMASAVPCVVTDVGDAARLVGDTGLVVPPRDPARLAAAVEALLAEPPADRRRRAVAAHRRVEERFGPDRLVDRTLAVVRGSTSSATSSPDDAQPLALRVVHVINGLEVGGAERMLVKLLAATDREQERPAVVSLRSGGPLRAEIEALGIPVVEIGLDPSRPDPGSLVRLIRALRRLRPDVVQTWLYKADLLGGLASRLARRPALVWSLRQSDPRRASRSNQLAARIAAALSHRLPDRIVALGDAAVEGHGSFGYDRRRMVVIPNGFDVDRFRPDPAARVAVREELGLPADVPLVGLVARVDPQKDHRTFVAAAGVVARRVPGARFVLVGEGADPGNRRLVGWLEAAGVVDACHLLGRRDDVERLTAALDVAVSSSAAEGFSNTLGEAMACGVVPVATRVGSAADLLDGVGSLVEPGDPATLGEAVARWLEASPDERAAVGIAARERIVDRYSVASVAAAYQDLHRELIGAERHVRARRTR